MRGRPPPYWSRGGLGWEGNRVRAPPGSVGCGDSAVVLVLPGATRPQERDRGVMETMWTGAHKTPKVFQLKKKLMARRPNILRIATIW